MSSFKRDAILYVLISIVCASAVALMVSEVLVL